MIAGHGVSFSYYILTAFLFYFPPFFLDFVSAFHSMFFVCGADCTYFNVWDAKYTTFGLNNNKFYL